MDAEKKKRMKTGTEMLIWGIPEELKHKFKMRCMEQEETMKDVIIDFMQKYTKA